MAKFEAVSIYYSERKVLGKYNTKAEAIHACVESARKGGHMCGETGEDISKALDSRGFYYIGYSSVELEVNEV